MTAPNKCRGNVLEREVVKLFEGHNPKRAFASDGRALGLTENVDVVVNKDTPDELRIQCKRKKVLPKWLFNELLNEKTGDFNCVVTRKERAKPLIIMDLELFIEKFYCK